MTSLLYSLIIFIAVTTAAGVARLTQRRLAMTKAQKLGIALGAFSGAMIGAKLPFVFSDWESFASGVAWFSNGKTILLGLVGGYAGVEIAKWCMAVRVRTGDTFAVPVAVAIAIGRIGCFVGGCCYGTPTELPWAVVFPTVDMSPRHPTQLYETAFHALAAIFLSVLVDRKLFSGNLIKLYIIAYALYRFGSEFIRPEVRSVGGLTLYQWASLVIVLGFSILWWRTVQDTQGKPTTQIE